MSNEERKPAFIKPAVSSSPFPLSVAHELAFNILDTLIPHCEKIHIAGSVRRKKEFVKDIEIVCEPKLYVLKDMFGWDEGVVRDYDFINVARNLGELIKGDFEDGKYCQIKLPEGINLDLFMPNADDYFRQLAIRTGSADYSWKIIASGWKKIGWCGSDVGLRKMSDCVETKTADGKSKWKCVNKNAELPPCWQSEEDFFTWINVKWCQPEERCL